MGSEKNNSVQDKSKGLRVLSSTVLSLKYNGHTKKLTAVTAPSLEDITPPPRLTISPKGSGQTKATSALLASPGCGLPSDQPSSEHLLPPSSFQAGCRKERSHWTTGLRLPLRPRPLRDKGVGRPWGGGVGANGRSLKI